MTKSRTMATAAGISTAAGDDPLMTGARRRLPADCRQPVAGAFAFEGPMERPLEYMPIRVQMKLALCGIKLSMLQWCGLPLAVRLTLLDTDCGVPNAMLRVRLYLEFQLDTLGLGPLLCVECDPRTWSAGTRLPPALRTAIKGLGLRCPPQYAWSALDDVQRFALINLVRPECARKLQAALAEFGLLPNRIGGGPGRRPAGTARQHHPPLA